MKCSLYDLVADGQLEKIKMLVTKNNVNNSNDASAWTLLHNACLFGWLDIVKYLVSIGAHINCKDDDGLMPIDVIKEFNSDQEIADYLQLVQRFKK